MWGDHGWLLVQVLGTFQGVSHLPGVNSGVYHHPSGYLQFRWWNLYPSFPPAPKNNTSNSPKQVEFPHHQAAKILTPSIIRGRLGLRVVTEVTFRSARCCRCGSLRASLEMIHRTSDNLFCKSNGCKASESNQMYKCSTIYRRWSWVGFVFFGFFWYINAM